MKILVGTISSNENELDQCLAAIREQTLPAHDLFLVSGKGNKEANDELYQTFMDRAGEVDLFIRIDADMVITRNTFFEEVAARFSADPQLGHLIIAVHDWMTDHQIMGMHVFRSTHRWNIGGEAYFLDVIDADGRMEKDRDQLAPAAIHCGDPSPYQAFHFGLHKAVKFTQLTREEVNLSQREVHWRHFKSLDRHYRKTKEPRLGLARIGFLHALAHHFGPNNVDYANAESRAAYDKYAAMDIPRLNACARRFGPVAWGFLPFKLRRKAADKYLRKS